MLNWDFGIILYFSKLDKLMDPHPYYSYVHSQDHIIISLNEQIQALHPLKESYSNLQRYHIKITQDL